MHNKYIIEPNGVESARLINQEYLLTEAMGGLFPVEIEPHQLQTVLNLGCGPGEWENEVAFKHRHIQIIGLDIDADMVKYAATRARVQHLENATFEVMDVKEPLDYPDNSFDLVSGRLLFGFMDRDSWPGLLKECYRVVKPGGIVCLAEYETTISNSYALQYLYGRLYKALADQERTYSVDRRSTGICHMLDRLLQHAGFIERASRSFHIDSSYGSTYHYAGCNNVEIAFALIKPYLLQAGKVEEAEYEALHAQMQLDLHQEGFTCISYGLRAWGYKP